MGTLMALPGIAFGGLRRPKGSRRAWFGTIGGRFSCRQLIVAMLSAASVLALAGGVARAEAPKLISYGSFASVIEEPQQRAESHAVPQGIALDQKSGGIYLAGIHAGVSKDLAKFDAAGAEVSPLSPFGEGDGIYTGMAVNPSNGDLYVLEGLSFETFGPKIATYDTSTGALVGTPFSVPDSRNYSGIIGDVQIASDSAGNVYLPVTAENEVLEYSPSGTLLNTFTGGSGAGTLNRPTGVAIDSLGNLWVADTGNHRIEELSPSDEPVREIKTGGEFNSKGEGVESVALDGHGDVFAIVYNSVDACGSLIPPCSHLVEYSSTGAQLADVGAGLFESGKGTALRPMVAVSEGSERVYVTDSSNEEVWIYGPPIAPQVNKELTAEVGASEAKLGALVNPGGTETTYRFEYGTTTAYGQSTPFPEGSVGEGLAPHAIWAAASGLAPDTTYHYRVVATGEVGTPVAGPDQTFTTESAEQSVCPNEALRGGFSAKLPDCRAYELVTPPNTSSVEFDSGLNRSGGTVAGDGEAISLSTKESLPGAPTGGEDYVTTRGASGWNVEDISPLEAYTGALCVSDNTEVTAYSDDISEDIISLGESTRASQPANKEACNADGLQVASGEPVGYQNLLLRDNATASYRLINTPPAGVTPADAHFLGASADLSHVVFGEGAQLTPNAPGLAVENPEDLYEWDEGALRLLTLLPGEIPATGALAQAAQGSNPISAEGSHGSHIFFTSGGALYVRIDGESTVQVDKTQGPGASGGGSFQAASADGSKVFFLDESKLTPDSTAQSGQPDLYECALAEGASSCELTDLTVTKSGEPADVLRVSVLGSKDDSHVYFVAQGLLATNRREYTDSEGNAVSEEATKGQHNLYVWSGGTITYIATLDENDFGAGNVSPDGTWFAFDSLNSLTGYDNTGPGGGLAEEVFLYSASSHELVCASCNPTGEAPASGGTDVPPTANARYLANGGRLFFETREALLPSDTNGQSDVYEYENGQPSLLSSGTSTEPSSFIGASGSGDDVFFTSSQQLVPQDTQEGMQSVYDARVDGGIPPPAAPPPCTTADACRTPVTPQPPIFGSPSSQSFSGAGNLAPPAKAKPKPLTCKRGYVKKKLKGKARCVRKPSPKVRKPARARRKDK